MATAARRQCIASHHNLFSDRKKERKETHKSQAKGQVNPPPTTANAIRGKGKGFREIKQTLGFTKSERERRCQKDVKAHVTLAVENYPFLAVSSAPKNNTQMLTNRTVFKPIKRILWFTYPF